MTLKWIFGLGLVLVVAAVTGCVGTVDGRHRAGMPFQRDRIEGNYERKPAEVYEAAKDVLKHHGAITSEDSVRSSLQGTVDNHNIWMAVEPVDTKVSRIVVQARKGGMADVDLAAFLEKEVAVRLATGKLNPVKSPLPK